MPRVRSFFLETEVGTGTRFDWTSGGEGVDARVVEVEIKLDEGQDAAKLTYLQVKVEITP